MTRQIFAAEINFDDAPVHVRETFNGSENNVRALLAEIRPQVQEAFILASRHRFAVYVVHESIQPLTDFFHSEHNLKGYVQFYYNSGESVTHLMATASGLLSPVKGEGGILSDLIECYQWACASQCLGIILDHALKKVIATGRRVRVATGIDQFCASVVETGLELLYNRLEDLHRKNFLIIGTGKLARVTIDHLRKEGFTNIAITDHDNGKATRFARKYGMKSFPMESLREYLPMTDVIIGVAHDELHLDFVATAESASRKISFVLDLAMRPNFDTQWVEHHVAEFYNLDDLRRMEPSPLDAFGGIEKAWRMVMKASNDFVLLLKFLQQSPVLTAYLNRQFSQKNGAWKVKPRRTLKHLLMFKKNDTPASVSHELEAVSIRLHVNNHVAENGAELVKRFSSLKKFPFFLSEN